MTRRRARFPRVLSYRRRRRASWRFKVAAFVCVVAVFVGLWQAAVEAAGRYGVFIDLAVFLLLGNVVWLTVWRPLIRRWGARHPRYREINLPAVDRMTGPQFEQYVAGLLRRDGWEDVVVSGGAGDFGADVIAYDRQGRKLVVQCKRFAKTRAVTSADMQRFLGTIRLVHVADFAWFVTSSRFTADATTLAEAGGVVLIDRVGLSDWSSRPVLASA